MIVRRDGYLLAHGGVFERVHVQAHEESGVVVDRHLLALRDRDVHVVRAREVRISADRPFTMYADGDPIAELPATVRVRHRALRVLVPA